MLAHPPGDTTRGSVVGPLKWCGEGVLVLGVYPGQEIPDLQIPAAAIQRLWVRGTQGIPGLVGGAVVGGISGGALASVKTRVCSVGSPPVTSTCRGDVFVSSAIGAGIGGLVGWVLGRGLPRWARVF